MLVVNTLNYIDLDGKFPCLSRSEFNIPTFQSLDIRNVPDDKSENDAVFYLCGNSLGLMPKQTRLTINRELDAWSKRGVESHFRHPDQAGTPWVDIDLPLIPLMAPIVGGEEDEIAIMNSLTSNLNSLLISFYRPTKRRYKILFEAGAFPSDCYAFYHQCRIHNVDPKEGLIILKPREDEYHLRMEEILKAIENNNETIALVCLPGIQYYTGQLFDIEKITEFAHKFEGIKIGWDLAHAVGNVELSLHKWDVDFAVWCSYKYLNSGPGGIGGIFVNNKHQKPLHKNDYLNRLAGWWGNNKEERFLMKETFDPIPSALGFRQSNPSVIDVVALKSSLEIFKKYGGIEAIRRRSLSLTNYLLTLLQGSLFYFKNLETYTNSKRQIGFVIITPTENPNYHGAQLSLLIVSNCMTNPMEKVFHYINQHGVIADERKPDVIRLAPAPLYNTFEDVYSSVQILQEALEHTVQMK